MTLSALEELDLRDRLRGEPTRTQLAISPAATRSETQVGPRGRAPSTSSEAPLTGSGSAWSRRPNRLVVPARARPESALADETRTVSLDVGALTVARAVRALVAAQPARARVLARELIVERTTLVTLVASEPDARSSHHPHVTVPLPPGASRASDAADAYACAARPPRASLVDVYV
jgi:hypothetical protein